jgi:hypothetical protein
MSTPDLLSGEQFEPTAEQIEQRARELCAEDGLNPDIPMPEGWDDSQPGAGWRGFVAQARDELIAENVFAK